VIVAISGLCYDPEGNACSAGAGKDTVANQLVSKHGFVKIGLADPMKRFVQEVFQFTDEQVWGESDLRNAPDERYMHTKAGALGRTDLRDIDDLKGTCYEPFADLLEDGFLPRPPADEYLTPRHALQQLGTEWGRACHEHVWVACLIRLATRLSKGGCYYDQKSGLRYFSDIACSDDDLVKPKTNVVVSDMRFKTEMKYIQEHGGKIIRVRRPVEKVTVSSSHKSENDLLDVSDEEFDYVIWGGTKDVPDLQMRADVMATALLYPDKHLVDEDTSEPTDLSKLLSKDLVRKRREDFESGRICPFDPDRVDVPPFKHHR